MPIRNRNHRLYSLFESQNGEWVRISPLSYPRQDAVRLFQSQLLAYFLGWAKGPRCLKVVKV